MSSTFIICQFHKIPNLFPHSLNNNSNAEEILSLLLDYQNPTVHRRKRSKRLANVINENKKSFISDDDNNHEDTQDDTTPLTDTKSNSSHRQNKRKRRC